VRRSGRSRIDELHFLLAFMRCNEGLPKRVFGELVEQILVNDRRRFPADDETTKRNRS